MIDLVPFIRAAWSRETSATPQEWSLENPARGQCAVTALLVQDTHGGDLLRGVVCGESHYWNRLPKGQILDLTLEQFKGAESPSEFVVRERAYVLGFEATRLRYEALRKAVEIGVAEKLGDDLRKALVKAVRGSPVSVE